MNDEDRKLTGIMTNLEMSSSRRQLQTWLGGVTMAEVVSLGLDQGRFVLVRASCDRLLKDVEKQAIVLPPEGIADVPVLLEAVLTLGGVTVIVVAGDVHPENPLLLDLVNEAKALIPRSKSHLVLQTWRKPSAAIYIQKRPGAAFVELSPGRLYKYPRLVAHGDLVGLFAFDVRNLYFFPNIVDSHRCGQLHHFDSRVLGVARLKSWKVRGEIRGVEFVVTTEQGMVPVQFIPIGSKTAVLHEEPSTSFIMQGTLENGGTPLVFASDPDGNLLLGIPAPDFVPARIAS
ncbi:MAG: hypothetical protein Q7S89_02675 [bacterium]|nr:hypothetical protein [bacterium]